jgi:DNA polymerase-1
VTGTGLDDDGDLALRAGEPVGLALTATSAALVADGNRRIVLAGEPTATIAALESVHHPRWVWWDRQAAMVLARSGVAIERCWDIAAVHRLMAGGWQNPIERVWSWLHQLDPTTAPVAGQLDFGAGSADDGDPEHPVRPDGHLRADWVAGGWSASPDRLVAWARLALATADRQRALLADKRALSTAHAESLAELLCVELELEGLPFDTEAALAIIAEAAGPRPASLADEDAELARRDAEVLQHLDPPRPVNLRNPADVKSMLAAAGIDLPDTRAWRMEKLRQSEPLVDALLTWRKAERIATTYGYRWIDEHVSGGRLRGQWASADGAAGRMTASAGLHNMPAPMRPAVAADPGHVFVRADLGQIEPRVLAAVSGDPALIAATADDDLYQPVAARLGVDRDVAKVAVLGAMYGATTGQSAGALRGLEQNYPVAMAFLSEAAEQGRLGNDIVTIGGRRIRTGSGSSPDGDLDRAVAAAAARGRYARNALIQGAAAEFFKVWAIVVRRRMREFGATVVLCLHDELLVHGPTDRADEMAAQVAEAVDETAFYWSPVPEVRFVVDVGTVNRWSEVKD